MLVSMRSYRRRKIILTFTIILTFDNNPVPKRKERLAAAGLSWLKGFFLLLLFLFFASLFQLFHNFFVFCFKLVDLVLFFFVLCLE